VDPGALAGTDAFATRIEAFVAAMEAEDGVRLPGSRRDALAARAADQGVEIPEALYARLVALAAS
jgi:(2R)-3-sulfolactate dehydrogenase (NADP+)